MPFTTDHFHNQQTRLWFFLTIIMFVVQYLQPEETLSFLKVIKPHLLIVLPVLFFWMFGKYDLFQWKYPQIKIFWLFTFTITTLALLSHNPKEGLFSIMYMVTYGVFMLSIIITINTNRRLEILNNTLITVAVFLSIRGLLTKEGDLFSKNGMFHNGNYFSDPNEFSLYLNMMVPFAYFALLSAQGIYKKLPYFLALLLFIFCIIVTFSRGGFLGLIAVGVVCWWFTPRRWVSLTVILTCCSFVFVLSPNSWKEEVVGTSLDTTESTAQIRLQIWDTSFNIFKLHPFGIGPRMTPEYTARDPMIRHPFESHSVWFTSLVESGIMGTVLFFGLIWYNIKYVFYVVLLPSVDRSSQFLRYFALACLAALVGFLTSGSLLTVNYMPHIWYLSAFIVVVAKLAQLRKLQILAR